MIKKPYDLVNVPCMWQRASGDIKVDIKNWIWYGALSSCYCWYLWWEHCESCFMIQWNVKPVHRRFPWPKGLCMHYMLNLLNFILIIIVVMCVMCAIPSNWLALDPEPMTPVTSLSDSIDSLRTLLWCHFTWTCHLCCAHECFYSHKRKCI